MFDARWMDRRLVCLAAACGLLEMTTATFAAPEKDDLGDLAEPMAQEVSFDLIETPMARALETLGAQVGQNILIHPGSRAAVVGRLVTMKIEAQDAYKALNLICLAAEADWYVREGVLIVGTEKYVRSLSIETRLFDIRELLESVPNYLGPDLSIDGALSNTSSGGSNARQSQSYSRGGGGGSGLFGDGDSNDLGRDVPSRAELVDHVTELIQASIGTPDEWLNEESTITELNGSLVVRSTPGQLDEVGELLQQLSATGGRMVTVEGQFYAVPRALLDQLNGRLVLDADGYARLAGELAGPNVRRVAAGRTVCFNGQRVYVYAGQDHAFLSDIEPIPDAAGVAPTLSTTRNGAVVDVKPTITLDGKSVSIAVRTEAVDRAVQDATALPVGRSSSGDQRVSTSGGMSGKVDLKGSDNDGEVAGRVAQAGEIDGTPEFETLGAVELGLPEHDLLMHRTNVRVPNGGAVVLSGATGQYDGIDAHDMEFILVLRTRIVE